MHLALNKLSSTNWNAYLMTESFLCWFGSCSESNQDAILVSVKVKDIKREIGRYCWNTKTHKLMSSGQKLDVSFVSHDRGPSTARGFNATYKFVTGKSLQTKLLCHRFHLPIFIYHLTFTDIYKCILLLHTILL